MVDANCWKCHRDKETIIEAFEPGFFDDVPILRRVPVLGKFTGYTRRKTADKMVYDRNFKTSQTYICVICRQQTYHILFERDLYPSGRKGKDWVKTAQGYVGIYNHEEISEKSRHRLQEMVNDEFEVLRTELIDTFGHLWADVLFERMLDALRNSPDVFKSSISLPELSDLLSMDEDVVEQIITVSLVDSNVIEQTDDGLQFCNISRLRVLLHEYRDNYHTVLEEYDLDPSLAIETAFDQKKHSIFSYFYPSHIGQKQDYNS